MVERRRFPALSAHRERAAAAGRAQPLAPARYFEGAVAARVEAGDDCLFRGAATRARHHGRHKQWDAGRGLGCARS